MNQVLLPQSPPTPNVVLRFGLYLCRQCNGCWSAENEGWSTQCNWRPCEHIEAHIREEAGT